MKNDPLFLLKIFPILCYCIHNINVLGLICFPCLRNIQKILKGRVTFWKLCRLVVCLVLIIPRFTLFWQPFSGRKVHLYACANVVFFLPAKTCLCWHSYRGDGFLVVIPKKRTGSIVAFFGKFPIHLYYVYTTAHALCFRFHMFIKK